ncbi:head-tail connector protein [Acuticoccus sediminis]|nr:head-tail connector protein [Acuticoccus sediminis]
MSLMLITPPATQPVTLDEAKAHLRVAYDDDDIYITDLITTATARLDGAYGLLGRCLITQTWRTTMPVPSTAAIVLPLGPHQSVDAITYLDDARNTVTIDPESYVVDYLGSTHPAVLTRVDGAPWPRTVSITFTAGYGDIPDNVPFPLRSAILLHVAHLFENRESTTTLGFLKELPHGYADLVTDYRAWAF